MLSEVRFNEFKSIPTTHAKQRLIDRGGSEKFLGWTKELKSFFTNKYVTKNILAAFDKSLNGHKPGEHGYEFFIYKVVKETTLAAIGVYKKGRYENEGYGILIATFLPFRAKKILEDYMYKDVVWVIEIDEYSNMVSLTPSKPIDPNNIQYHQQAYKPRNTVKKNYTEFVN